MKREQGSLVKQIRNGAKGQRLQVFIVVRAPGQREGFCGWTGLAGFDSPTHTKGMSTRAFLAACPFEGQKRKKEG